MNEQHSRNIRLGVDVGGTFTDVVAVTAEGRAFIAKLPTESDNTDSADAIVAGLLQHLQKLNATPKDLAGIVHATTLATNTVLERSGGPTAMVTTAGFRDFIEIGEELVYELYNGSLTFPAPLIARGDRFPFEERTLADGTISTAIDAGEVEALVSALAARKYRSLAICFLHSHRNPTNERELGERLQRAFPELAISLSSTALPETGEYARFSAASIDAYVKPAVTRYLARLQRLLAEREVSSPLSIMLSNGGNCDWEVSVERPSLMVESGPAAGVMAVASLQRSGQLSDRALAFDMGGTTAKISFLRSGHPLLTRSLEIGRESRFQAGSGLLLALPSVDVLEIGAGGGSIASVDEAGLLQVGPRSAGARPGPACYGFGGMLPTVTDANLVLGYLVPEAFAGGTIALDRQAARAAVATGLSRLGMDPVDAAVAVHRVVVANMALAARVAAAERGVDVRSFELVAFGGAGPMHAAGVAKILGVGRVIVPPGAGVMSSFGCLAAPRVHEIIRPSGKKLPEIDWRATSEDLLGAMNECENVLRRAATGNSVRRVRTLQAEMRYKGQRRNRLYIDVPLVELERLLCGESVAAELHERFESAYVSQYGRTVPGGVPEIMIWRVRVTEAVEHAPPSLASTGRFSLSATHTDMVFPDFGRRSGWLMCRDALEQGGVHAGPGVIIDEDCTTVVPPDFSASLDQHGSVVLERLAK